MGKILQKKKNRSGLSKARPKSNRLKNGHKKINVLGNAIIADNWYAEAPNISIGQQVETKTLIL